VLIIGELHCSLNYINPTDVMPEHATLHASEVAIINNAVTAIDNRNVLCEEGLTMISSILIKPIQNGLPKHLNSKMLQVFLIKKSRCIKMIFCPEKQC